MSTLFILLFLNIILLCSSSCNIAFSSSSSSSKIEEENYQTSNVDSSQYCIYLGIRYQKANNVITTVYIQDDENSAKNTLSSSSLFNSTIRAQINIDCENALSVSKSGSTVSYSYYCCPDFDNQYNIRCTTPSVPLLTGGSKDGLNDTN